MKDDTTRSTYKKTKHYNRVLMQQGRVQLDADWNEQFDITAHRVDTETRDVVGRCGAPMHDSGFHVVATLAGLTVEEQTFDANQPPAPPLLPGDLLISGGRYYVDGILCENERIIAYTKQADLPGAHPVTEAGTYLAYIDVWSRHITPIEDPQIREVALGGPDTATREKTVWQVKLQKVNEPVTCLNAVISDPHDLSTSGKLAARAATTQPSNNPCIVDPGAGYRRLENQHYRVEVHDPGSLRVATFKWSRDNGSIVTRWKSYDTNKLTVESIGKDKVLSFASGQWVELLDDTNELLGTPGTLVQLVKAEGNVLTIDPNSVVPSGATISIPTADRNPKVRRWDMITLLQPQNDGFVDLEDGVQVRFTNGDYKTGDYWLIPARVATADVEWPRDSSGPMDELPHGIKHHYCKLALAKFNGETWTVTDCRKIFPPISEMTNFFYVGGDGQEVMPDLTMPGSLTPPLAQPLEVGVANGQWPVGGATVRFRITKGNGDLHGPDFEDRVKTLANGIASCTWRLGPAPQSQQVEAALLDHNDNPINIPIHFNANLSVASQVAYDPKQCGSLKDQKSVQDAFDTLTALTSLYLVRGDNQAGAPNVLLPQPLVVVASNDCGPVANVPVRFAVSGPPGETGKLTPIVGPPQGIGDHVLTSTDGQGIAQCKWSLGPRGPQVVDAVLNPEANPLFIPPTRVQFTARIEYPGFHVTGLFMLPPAGPLPLPEPPPAENPLPPAGPLRVADPVPSTIIVPPTVLFPLKNDSEVEYQNLDKGILITFDANPDPHFFDALNKHNPVVFVTLERPIPLPVSNEATAVGSFLPSVLPGTATVSSNTITWKPTANIFDFLQEMFGDLVKQIPPPPKPKVLARFTAKSKFIWKLGNPDVYLDGDAFGLPPGANPNDLRFGGDQKRGGDLEMWFWLVAPTVGFVTDQPLDNLAQELETIGGDNRVPKPLQKAQKVPRAKKPRKMPK